MKKILQKGLCSLLAISLLALPACSQPVIPIEDVSGYTIVYGAGSEEAQTAAELLADTVKETLGLTLPVTDDTAAAVPQEILIGDTTRLTAADAAKKRGITLRGCDYLFAGDGEKLAVLANSPFLLSIAVEALEGSLLTADGFCWSSDIATVGSGIDTTDAAEKAEGADIRMMSWNILNPQWSGLPAEEKIGYFTQNLYYYLPDVIGVQEASAPWHALLDRLPAPYAPIAATTDNGQTNMTMFFYNTDTLTLIESGTEDVEANSPIRVVAWAVLETGDGKRFLVTNTHPDSRAQQCAEQMEIFIEKATALETTYSLPMLCVGDFNAIEKASPYRALIKAGFTDCKYADGVTLVKDKDSYLQGDWGGKITTGKGSRDHVFFRGAVTPLLFNTVIDNEVTGVSDHLPVYADVRFDG